MSEDALVERLAEAIAKRGIEFNPWADPHAPGNAEWFAHYRDIARAVLPIVEDHVKAEKLDTLRDVERVIMRDGATEAGHAVRRVIAQMEAS